MTRHDFARRASRLLDARKPVSQGEHERRMLKTECTGCYLCGVVHTVGVLFVLWLLWKWVEIGGLPYVSQ